MGHTMTYSLVPERSRGPGWLGGLLLLGIGASLAVAALALLGYVQARRAPSVLLQVPPRPADAWVSQAVPSRWALLELADAHPEPLLHQAVEAGQIELAYAILAFNLDISGPARATEAIRVGFALARQEQDLPAAAALGMAQAVAVFDRSIPPLERGTILAQVAQGYELLGVPDAARGAALQAQHLAVQTPDLLPAQRLRILEEIGPVLERFGTPEQRERWRALRRGPELELGRVLLSPLLPGLYRPPPVSPFQDEGMAQAEDLRRRAARRLVERLERTGGVDFEPERRALAQALVAEDQARAAWSRRLDARLVEPGARFLYLQERRRWLLWKLRVAYRGFGLSLVPAWEAQIPEMWTELTRATEALLPVLERLAALPEDPRHRAVARSEALAWLAYQAELGFYPQAPLGELATRLEGAQAELERLGVPPALPLFYDVAATPPGFRIARRYE